MSLRVLASFEVLGPPGDRRGGLRLELEPAREYERWEVDGIRCSVRAVWVRGELWLAGARVFALPERRSVERLEPGTERPPGVNEADSGPWTRIAVSPGCRYLASSGSAQAPAARLGERSEQLAAALDVPAGPTPGWWARQFGNRAADPEAAALVIDVVESEPARDLEAWLDELHERGLELDWAGNEGGPGLMGCFRLAREGEGQGGREGPEGPAAIVAAMLDHARADPTLAAAIREHAEVWIEDGPGESESDRAGRLVAEDPTRGWIELLEPTAIAESIDASTGAWLDPGTAHARAAWTHQLPGAAILEQLREHLDDVAIVAIHSAPSEAVLAVHLVGGIDRSHGDLVGFALARIWT